MSDSIPAKTVVLPTDPEAAELVTIQLWKARDGRMYDDERVARYAGSTHRVCACGVVTDKHRTRCDRCQAKADHDDWLALPLVEWDGSTPLCTFRGDTYFFSREEIDDHLDNLDERIAASDLDLVLCEPRRPRMLDEDYFSDDLPEDGDFNDLPKAVQDAVEAFNKAVRECSPTCWYPAKKRVVLS